MWVEQRSVIRLLAKWQLTLTTAHRDEPAMTSKHGRMLINAGECSDMAVRYATWLRKLRQCRCVLITFWHGKYSAVSMSTTTSVAAFLTCARAPSKGKNRLRLRALCERDSLRGMKHA
jgi:hypothetical protein